MIGRCCKCISQVKKCIYVLKCRERRLEDDVIALRSAPPAGQRQACLQHDFGLSWNRKPRHRGLQTRFSTIMCKIYSFSFFRYLLDNTSFSFFFYSGFLFFCFFFSILWFMWILGIHARRQKWKSMLGLSPSPPKQVLATCMGQPKSHKVFPYKRLANCCTS